MLQRRRWLGLVGGGLFTTTDGRGTCSERSESTASTQIALIVLSAEERPVAADGLGDTASSRGRETIASAPEQAWQIEFEGWSMFTAAALANGAVFARLNTARTHLVLLRSGESVWRAPGAASSIEGFAVVVVGQRGGSEWWRVAGSLRPVVQPAGVVSVGVGQLYVVGQTDELAG
jgi:hypothetical protein